MRPGDPPSKGDTTRAILAANLRQAPPRLDYVRDDVPAPVCRAIEKALQKEPAERFQGGNEFIIALGQPVPRLSSFSRALSVRRLRRIPKTRLAGITTAVLVVVGVSLYFMYRTPAS